MNVTTYGVDVAKRVFQVHWVEPETGEVKRKRLARAEVRAFFARREPGVVAMEACGSAHHWGRLLQSLGHEVTLIAAQFVRPFVKTNKPDAADAEAIWEACQRPRMRFVAVKSVEQQAVLSLHRIRQQFVKIRTMQAHQVRGLLYESECQRIAAIPGVGRLTASAVVATVADARTFRSGREFAAFLGLVPRQSGTGGRVKLLGISKRGDPYLRTLLIHGARAVLRPQSRTDRTPDPWLKELLARRPKNVAIMALANKMARTAGLRSSV
jgi:transposase